MRTEKSMGDFFFRTKIIFRSIVLFKGNVKKYILSIPAKIQTEIIIITKTIHALQIKFLTTADLT